MSGDLIGRRGAAGALSESGSADAENPAFAAYLAAARGRPGLWRILVVLFLLLVFQILLLFLIVTAAAAIGAAPTNRPWSLAAQTVVTLAVRAATPLALALSLRLIHGRGFASLLGHARRLERAPLLIGAIAAVALSFVGLALGAGLGLIELSMVQQYRPLWPLLLAAALLIPVQAAAEELIFRGYLLQEIGLRAPHAIAWAGAPSALFAILHFGGGETRVEALAYVGSTFLFGLFAAALVWRTAGLSAAIGLHASNNWLALCLFEPPQGVAGFGPIAWRYADGGLVPSLALQALLLGAALALLWRLLPRPAATGALSSSQEGRHVQDAS